MTFDLSNNLTQEDLSFFYATTYQSALDNGVSPRSADPVEALKIFRQEIEEYNHSKKNFTMIVAKDEYHRHAGIIWLANRNGPSNYGLIHDPAWVYDILVRPEHRRKGLGRQLLAAGETWAYGQGYATLGLHVFGHNQPAIALYKKCGYELKSCYLQKDLNGNTTGEPVPAVKLRRVSGEVDEQTYKQLSYNRFARFSCSSADKANEAHNNYLERFGFNPDKHMVMLVEDNRGQANSGLWFYKNKGDLGESTYVWAQEVIGEDCNSIIQLYHYLEGWALENKATSIRTMRHCTEYEIIAAMQAQDYHMTNLFMFKKID